LWKIKVEGKVKCFLVYGCSPGGKFGQQTAWKMKIEEELPHIYSLCL
jgi:hypothetical protein